LSREPTPPTWFPDGKIDPARVNALSSGLQGIARDNGFTRETYAAAVAQMAEALTGFSADDDIDGEVMRFVAERLRAAADAMDGSTN
jgi:hypothetical protein